MAKDVFISYSHVDFDTTVAVCEKLESEGIECWYAPRDIGPGEEWASAIMEALHNCRIMILVFTDASNASVQVLREVNNAISDGKTVIPFKLTENEPTGGMDYYLSTLHWLDASGRPLDKSLDDLCGRVRDILEGKEETFVPPAPQPVQKKKKRSIKSLLLGIPAAVVNLIFGIVILFSTLSLCSFRNPVAAAMMAVSAVSFIVLVFQVASILNKRITKYHWWICLGLCIVASVFFLIYASVFNEGLQPSDRLPDGGQEISLNSANYSFAVRSSDGTVYFCDNDSDQEPSIRYCSYEDFIAGEKGNLLVNNVWADNLTLAGVNTLVFRDYSNDRQKMKMIDLRTGKITVLKRRSCYAYHAGEACVYYGEDTTASMGLGVIRTDGKYDGMLRDIHCTGYNICYYENSFYYLNQSGFLCKDSDSNVQSAKAIGHFVIYDDIVYYCGTTGGLFRMTLGDRDSAEELASGMPRAITVCGDHVYYLDDHDNSYLYRIPLEGGEPELVLEEYFNTLNVIGDCLYLCNDAESYTRLNVSDIS